jgi:cytoskeletal protein CcmA (bactofilin family)
MGYDGETLDRGVANAKRAATDSLEFLKSATGLGKGKPGMEPVSTPAPAVAAVQTTAPVARSPRVTGPTVLSPNVEIAGSINSRDELHIYGKVDGNVRATSVTVCEGGSVTGDVVAESVTVNGTVKGRVYGRQVRLLAAAVVEGDVFHSGLGVDTNAMFEGASRRMADPLADFEMPVPVEGK